VGEVFSKPAFIIPQWPAPCNVKALQSTCLGGVSVGGFASLNLGDHVNDNPEHVAQNRLVFEKSLPSPALWLKQVHSTVVVNEAQAASRPAADASYTRLTNKVCTVMTADCLPVLFCNTSGTQVAAAHAGWRGLVNGVLEETLNTFNDSPSAIMAWLGPAIGPTKFEVGQEVYEAFCSQNSLASSAFKKVADSHSSYEHKWLADLYALARLRLKEYGVESISGGDFCTYSDESRFFSFRRNNVCGRMASSIWLE
jgi:YfiH family protein